MTGSDVYADVLQQHVSTDAIGAPSRRPMDLRTDGTISDGVQGYEKTWHVAVKAGAAHPVIEGAIGTARGPIVSNPTSLGSRSVAKCHLPEVAPFAVAP